ncbi:LysR family transcriptional regulator [Oceanobacter mangrovi]|uniref:LysR family transcriptional regulator n=1 Tax=Oceanobacter mangrovi TaxID=2862510 RepID=UPI001C8EF73C|nr:LysR family transcriptional regulator [Oceanobacter mangrovi]
MNTRQLLYLVTCARTGSIAAAARELDIAQPSISQQMAALEHELKVTLLERDHKGVRLTAAGQKFLPAATSALQLLEQARSDLRDEQQPYGRVVIGMTQPIGNALAVPLMAAMHERYPGIELDLQTGLSSSLYQMLRQGEVDLLVCSEDASRHMDMSSEYLLTEKLVLAVGTTPTGSYHELCQRNSISFAELAEYPVMYTSEKDSLGYRVEQYEQLTGIRLQRQNPFGQLLTTLRYVVDGYGMLLCSTTAVYPQIASGEIHVLDIVEPETNRVVNLIRMHERKESRVMALLAELIEDLSQQLIDNGVWAVSQ